MRLPCPARHGPGGAIARATGADIPSPPHHPSSRYGVTTTTPTKFGYADGGWFSQWYLYVPAVVNSNW